MKRAACYVRVSTEEQKRHGLSVDNQIIALKEYCLEHDYEMIGIYSDAGISARKKYTKRPALLKLIEDCKNDKVDIILFTKLDRWFRSVGDYYEVQSHLNGIPWRAIWEDYETETSSGVFKVNIMLSVAQAEADRTAERIKNTFEYKRSKGDYIGSAPIGYKRVDNQLVIDEETAPIIRLIFDTYIKTHSSAAVMRKLMENGVNMSRSGVAHIIKSDTYKGNAYGYKCPAYLTEEEGQLVADIRKGNYRTPAHNHIYIFSGLCKCGFCQGKMRSAAAINRKADTYYKNYYCTGIDRIAKHDRGFSYAEKHLEKYLLKELDHLVADHNATVLSTNAKDIKKTIKTKANLEEKLKRIGVRYEEGDITTEEYKEKRKAILTEIASLSHQDNIKPIELPPNWKELYKTLDEEHKQSFWFSLIKSITLYPVNTKDPEIFFL